MLVSPRSSVCKSRAMARTELVHIGQLGLAAELDVDAYVDNVFNFPTMAEAYRIAAFDIVKPARTRQQAARQSWMPWPRSCKNVLTNIPVVSR
jgi:hypothetical protein